MEELAKILSSLSPEIKKQIAEQLLASCSTPSEQPQPKKKRTSTPKKKTANQNMFHQWIKGEVAADVKKINAETKDFDKKIKRSVSPRPERTTLAEIHCRSCKKQFKVSKVLLKHDGDSYYYECNQCMKGRR